MALTLVPLGTLNRLRSSLQWASFPALNVTAPFLGKRGIILGFEGDSTLMVDALTGMVTSPEPFIKAQVTLTLLKTQALATQYKVQMEQNALLGQCTIRGDASQLASYQLVNCAIMRIGELSFAGDTPDYAVTIAGTYYINSTLWT